MDRKVAGKRQWSLGAGMVERIPDRLVVSYEEPGIMAAAHWHAQVEVNYVFRGTMRYAMQGHGVDLVAGDLAVFWGGLPHRVVDTGEDTLFVAIHLPLIHFFRLRLAAEIQQRLMQGATLVTSADDAEEGPAFRRWVDYLCSDDPLRIGHAIDEILLRIERIRFAPYRLLGPEAAGPGPEAPDQVSFQSVGRICTFVAKNFREDICSTDIAHSADIHPKYAMSVFKKSTGMTLNEYVSLLRLSYAQAQLMREDASVLEVAMESGFGSLSAFNKCFRKISGMSPNHFRREHRARLPAA
ncbi:MAG: helix-turn-helix domain-containing protein [Amaricoccus sp.]|mgnify:CR=1 FL=1